MNSVAGVQSDHWTGSTCFLATLDTFKAKRLLYPSTGAVANIYQPAPWPRLDAKQTFVIRRLNLHPFGKHPQNSEISENQKYPKAAIQDGGKPENAGPVWLQYFRFQRPTSGSSSLPVATHGGSFTQPSLILAPQQNNSEHNQNSKPETILWQRSAIFNGEK